MEAQAKVLSNIGLSKTIIWVRCFAIIPVQLKNLVQLAATIMISLPLNPTNENKSINDNKLIRCLLKKWNQRSCFGKDFNVSDVSDKNNILIILFLWTCMRQYFDSFIYVNVHEGSKWKWKIKTFRQDRGYKMTLNKQQLDHCMLQFYENIVA